MSLTVENLRVYYRTLHGDVQAVDGTTFHIADGEIMGLAGESGCGKSTLGRLLLRLIPADAGSVRFEGSEVPAEPGPDFRSRAQIVFQNPDSSLNPRKTVAEIIRRPIVLFGIAKGRAADAEVDRLLELVRLSPAYRDRFPHQLSGGEKQRVGIARALASRPNFVVCDEAVSALDVSVQAAVLNLLEELRARLGVAYLFISHDIGVIAHVADRIAVMYRGRIVEEGPVEAIFRSPGHPYTQALLDCEPALIPSGTGRLPVIAGEVPRPGGRGCDFAGRCRHVEARCQGSAAPWQVLHSDRGHYTRCHRSAS